MNTDTNHTADTPRSAAPGVGEWGGQEFVRATVHLAGPVPIETGHTAHYSAEHVQARIGSALLYFLDYLAARDFTTAVTAAAEIGTRLFPAEPTRGLPRTLRTPGQDTSVIVRLRGRQPVAVPHGMAGSATPDGRAYLTCQLGGLVLVLHSREALARLVAVADTVHRVAAALWPQDARRVHDIGPDSGRDTHADAWDAEHPH